ncbi:MAG: glycosyl transferase [Gammaproteobacteria bacterium]
MLVYTSITKSYIPKARVLAKSVKRIHPDWTFVLLFSDKLPDNFDLNEEPFDEILTIEQLEFPNWQAWAFGHSIVELCTAVKALAAEKLAERPGTEKIMYLDPDIRVFNSLEPLNQLLDDYDILLTPHLLDIEREDSAVRDNEISALKHGIYNLGFFAAKTTGQGLDFIQWWSKRLQKYCRDDIPAGLFTDQRWCDLAPCFFSKLHIVRDRGYNVATWNIAHRKLTKNAANELCAGNTKLRFYHFTGYDSGDGKQMLNHYASDQKIASELWENYHADLLKEGHGDQKFESWYFGYFSNKDPIPIEARRLFRDRLDLQQAFKDPYSVISPCFLDWWKTEIMSNSQKQEVSSVDEIENNVIFQNIFTTRISKKLRLIINKIT